MPKTRTLRRTPLLGVSVLVAATVLFTVTAGAQERASGDVDEKATFTASATKRFTQTSIKPQSGDTNVQVEVANITAPNDPFSFRRTSKIVSINRVIITATMDDADSGPGSFDENDLVLKLDGIDTGIKLNGFRNNQLDTRTNSGEPINKRALKNALKQDRKLQAAIIDRDPGDNNDVSLPANLEAKLTIKGKVRR